MRAHFQSVLRWRLRIGYRDLHEKFTAERALVHPTSPDIEALDPHRRFLLHSMLERYDRLELDVIACHTNALPPILQVPSCFAADVRLAWRADTS